MSFDISCSFICVFPESPLPVVENTANPFPDISGHEYADLLELLPVIARKMSAEHKKSFRDSYGAVFKKGDLKLQIEETLDPDPRGLSPTKVSAITKLAATIPEEALMTALEKCSETDEMETFGSIENVRQILQEIMEAFQMADAQGKGIYIG